MGGGGRHPPLVLGAGLDTVAYSHRSTQDRKRGRLSDAGINVPAGVRYAAVDFEVTDLRSALDAAGVDRSGRPISCGWGWCRS